MRVNDHNALGTVAAETGRAPETSKVERGGGQPDRVGSGGDRIEFSYTLGSLSRSLSSLSSQRAERVQALAADYQSGQYQPDALATSRAMVAEGFNAEAA